MNRAGGSSLTQNRGSAGAIGPLVGGEAEDVRGHQVADRGGDGAMQPGLAVVLLQVRDDVRDRARAVAQVQEQGGGGADAEDARRAVAVPGPVDDVLLLAPGLGGGAPLAQGGVDLAD